MNGGNLELGVSNALSTASAVHLGTSGAVAATLQNAGGAFQGTATSISNGTASNGVTTGGSRSGPATTTAGLGALTLTGNASIDFESNYSTLVFSGYTQTGQTLDVLNYYNTDAAASNDTTSGFDGSDARLIFNAGSTTLNATQVASLYSNIYFVNPNGSSSFTDSAAEIALGGGYYEIVPAAVPEPATYIGSFLLIAGAAWQYRRRTRQIPA